MKKHLVQVWLTKAMKDYMYKRMKELDLKTKKQYIVHLFEQDGYKVKYTDF